MHRYFNNSWTPIEGSGGYRIAEGKPGHLFMLKGDFSGVFRTVFMNETERNKCEEERRWERMEEMLELA